MRSIVGRRASKAGMPPGSVVFTGRRKVDEVVADRISFDSDALSERYGSVPSETVGQVAWFNPIGLDDIGALEALEADILTDAEPGALARINDLGQDL